MVAYDFSKEPNNPWDTATWNPRAQIDFIRRTRAAHNYVGGNAEKRIAQRIAQSDTKGIPPRVAPAMPPRTFIIQKRIITGAGDGAPENIRIGFGVTGAVPGGTQWTLPVLTKVIGFPSTTSSEARCDVAPTGTVTVTLTDSDSNILCTVTFASGSTVGTFDWTVPTGYAAQPGDLLYVTVEGANDATFAGLNLAFIGLTSSP
jgi:hypothetical protein